MILHDAIAEIPIYEKTKNKVCVIAGLAFRLGIVRQRSQRDRGRMVGWTFKFGFIEEINTGVGRGLAPAEISKSRR